MYNVTDGTLQGCLTLTRLFLNYRSSACIMHNAATFFLPGDMINEYLETKIVKYDSSVIKNYWTRLC